VTHFALKVNGFTINSDPSDKRYVDMLAIRVEVEFHRQTDVEAPLKYRSSEQLNGKAIED
jgi:hypothetical protein